MSMVVLRHLGHAHCVLLRHLVMPTALSFVIKKTALSFRYVNWTAGLTCSIAINYV